MYNTQEVETVLFALTSVAESVDMEECTWLPQLFANLGHVPYTHQKVVCQALCLIGEPEFMYITEKKWFVNCNVALGASAKLSKL